MLRSCRVSAAPHEREEIAVIWQRFEIYLARAYDRASKRRGSLPTAVTATED